MKEETIKQLYKIAKPESYSKDEYICYEGELGKDMYIILKGSVGVYITSAMGTPVEIAVLNTGDFFGEMAIFDKLPRSASCVALEDSMCVAINESNLIGFMCQCPDVMERILKNMSKRVRKLNDELYKSTKKNIKERAPQFEIPKEYGFSHTVKEPYQEKRYFSEDTQCCPICGKEIKTINIKRHLMEKKNVDMDCRVNYLMCDPLWYEVLACPHCLYSNYRIDFFNINSDEVEGVKNVLKQEHKPVLENAEIIKTSFDNLVVKYLQAIHINEVINDEDHLLIGTLWLYLYWLAKDSGDDIFTAFCANKAIDKLQVEVDKGHSDMMNNKYSIALSLANLYAYKDMKKQARKYGEMALESMDDTIRACAQNFINYLDEN